MVDGRTHLHCGGIFVFYFHVCITEVLARRLEGYGQAFIPGIGGQKLTLCVYIRRRPGRKSP